LLVLVCSFKCKKDNREDECKARQGKATENFRTVDQRGDDRNKFTTVVGFMSINKMQLDINKIVELWYTVAAS
jgi:hypothetical protein